MLAANDAEAHAVAARQSGPAFRPARPVSLFFRRRLRDGEWKSAPACDIDHREHGNLQAAFGTIRTASEEVPQTERLLPLFGMKEASCAETSSERESSASATRSTKVRPVKRLPDCRALVRSE